MAQMTLAAPAKGKRGVQPVNEMTVADALQRFACPAGETHRVQIVRPSAAFSARAYSTATTLPIGAAYLAAILEKAGYAVDIIDGIGENIEHIRPSPDGQFLHQGLSVEEIVARVTPDTKIVGVSMMFSQNWLQYKDLVEAIRAERPDVTIIAGGEHITALTEFSLRDCPAIDYAVAGEGELILLEMVHRLVTGQPVDTMAGTAYLDDGGRFVHNGLGRRLADFQNLPWPAWHLVPVDNFFSGMFSMGIGYGRNMLILATRGCPYQCTFCSNPQMWTTRYLMRDVKDVVDEIEWLVKTYGCNSVDFADLTAIVKKEWVLSFCDELERRKLDIAWQLPSGTRSEALDETTVRRLYETGCRFLVYAPESGSQETLEIIKKKVNPKNLLKSLTSAVKIGHTTKVCMIIGFPHERRKHVIQTLLYAMKLARIGVSDCNISPFSPYPGSELFEQLRGDGTIGELDRRYFVSLLGQFDFTSTSRYCRHVGGRELAVYRFLGMATFYALSYLLHPSRITRLIGCAIRGKFQARSLAEQRVYDFFGRRRLQRQSAARDAQPPRDTA